MSISKERQLWQAATDGNLELVKKLAEDPSVDVNWVNDADERKDTILHRACRFGHLEIVKVLLGRKGIDVNKGNKGRGLPSRCFSRGPPICGFLVVG